MAEPLRLFLVAGEHSGDHLGARFIAALREQTQAPLVMEGVAGAEMEAQGCPSLFPISELAIMSPVEILLRLRPLLRRVREAADAALRFRPDMVVLFDSPEFTHAVAKQIRKRAPGIPIVDYVSPSVWAWRPGRAKRMRRYIDQVLAILPFEPEVHRRLGGPPCAYVGHPLIERLDWIRALDSGPLAARLGLDPAKPVIVVLPGSRGSEVRRLMQPFGETLGLLRRRIGDFEVVLPAVHSVLPLIEERLPAWPMRPRVVLDEADKFRAFKLARVALAASGTVTLELGLSGTPMVVGYRIDALASRLRWLLSVQSIVLANLILERNVFPEFIQQDCTPDKLAQALAALTVDGEIRDQQLTGLDEIASRMVLPEGGTPSAMAVRVALCCLSKQPISDHRFPIAT